MITPLSTLLLLLLLNSLLNNNIIFSLVNKLFNITNKIINVIILKNTVIYIRYKNKYSYLYYLNIYTYYMALSVTLWGLIAVTKSKGYGRQNFFHFKFLTVNCHIVRHKGISVNIKPDNAPPSQAYVETKIVQKRGLQYRQR